MAMTNDAIAKARDAAGEIKTKIEALQKDGEQLKNILTGNGNYQYFKIGTDKGTSVDSKLNDTINLIKSGLVPALNSVVSSIYACCAAAEKENRERAEAEAAARGVASGSSNPMAEGVSTKLPSQDEILDKTSGWGKIPRNSGPVEGFVSSDF